MRSLRLAGACIRADGEPLPPAIHLNPARAALRFEGGQVVGLCLDQLSDETEAERLVLAGMSRLNPTGADLAMLPKGADRKKVLVWLLKKRTPMGNKWIVQRLHAGHPSNIPRHVAAGGGAEPGSRLKELAGILECED